MKCVKIMTKNGNEHYEMPWNIVLTILSIFVIAFAAVGFVVSSINQVEANAGDIEELRGEIVPKSIYNLEMKYIKEKLDEISLDIKEIKEGRK